MIEDVPKKKERKKEGSEERKKKRKQNRKRSTLHKTRATQKRDHADSKVQAAKEPHGGGIVTIH